MPNPGTCVNNQTVGRDLYVCVNTVSFRERKAHFKGHTCCLSQGFYLWDETPWPKTTGGRKGVCGLHFHSTAVKGSQDRILHMTGIWRQKPRRSAAHWLAANGLLRKHRTQDHQPGGGGTQWAWPSSWNAYSLILRSRFVTWGFLLSGDSRLCQMI